MRDELLEYYNRELTVLRQLGAQFAEKYKGVAPRLLLEATKQSEDPHVERLLEAFAFLAARIHLKIDDDFPEITESLLGVLYPHFIRPVPSMTIVEFQIDREKGNLTTGLGIERDTMLYSRPAGGAPCKFKTCYDTTLWPLTIKQAEWRTPDVLRPAIRSGEAAFAMRLELRANSGALLPAMGLDRLRIYLHGESVLIQPLYELLCRRVKSIVVRDPSAGTTVKPVTLPASSIRPFGFGEDEGLLPYPRRSFIGYRLLQEFFSLPEKFLFIEIAGLRQVWAGGFKESAEIIFLIEQVPNDESRQRLERDLNPGVFRLACTPAINLFPHTCEPILLDQRKYEYAVIPDVKRRTAYEVFSIDGVGAIDRASRENIEYHPFYSYSHEARQAGRKPCFWISTRRESNVPNDDGSDLYLTFVDLSMRQLQPDNDTITVDATCTNRGLPSRLPFGNESGDFEMEGDAPVKRIVCLRKPTDPLRPPTGRMMQWRLISHLSLNYLSLVEEGREGLQQLLRLYEFSSSDFANKMIEGITKVSSQPHFGRIVSENGIAFARGTRVDMELDEEQFVGGGAYLFASVIERFLALYASLNSFTQLNVTSRQRKEPVGQWPPRAGNRILL